MDEEQTLITLQLNLAHEDVHLAEQLWDVSVFL